MALIAYHLDELAIALDPTRPQYLMPDLQSCRVGIVDVGCGIGQLFVAKDQEIPAGVARFGIDYDAEAIAYAKEKWPHLAQFTQGQAEKLPIAAASVDWYVSRVALPYTHLHLSIPEAARVLTPGGRLWISLHPASVVWRSFRTAAARLRPRTAISHAIVLLNGALLHLTGRAGMFGLVESWQSTLAIERLLKRSGFHDVTVTRNAQHFLVEARRA